MTEIFYLDTREINPDIYKKMLAVLSENRVKKAENYLKTEDRYLSAGAGYLLDFALKKLGLSEKNFPVIYGENGKPLSELDGLYFSLSHSGHYAFCAFSDIGEVGVDVQKTVFPEDALTEKVCTDEERKRLSLLGKKERAKEFTEIWAVKESYIKYLGEGFSLPLKGLETCFFPRLQIKREGEEAKVFFRKYRLTGYSAAVCGEKDGFSELYKVKIEL